MNTSIEKQQGPVSNSNCYPRSKVAKNINQAINLLVASQRENFNVNSDNNINVVVTTVVTTATILVLTIKKQLENQKKINLKLSITLLIIAMVKK